MRSSPPGTLRAGSVSSMRSSIRSPKRRLATALSALPTCSVPVGLGANRTFLTEANLVDRVSARRRDTRCDGQTRATDERVRLRPPRRLGRSLHARASAHDEGAPGGAARDHGRLLRVGGAERVVEGGQPDRGREPRLPRPLAPPRRRLLPRLHPRLDPHARRVGHPRLVPGRAAGGDGLNAREVPARRRLDAGGARGRSAARRGRDRDADRPRVDPRRGGTVGDLGRARVRREPRVGARRRRAAAAPDRLRGPLRRAAAPARVPPARPPAAASVRRLRRAAAVRADDDAAPLLLRHLADRGLRALLPAPQRRRRPRPLDRRVPRRARSEPLPFGLTMMLLLFYCGTWLIGGFALYFLLRSVGADPGLSTVAFLGGTSAVGAIVAVLAVFSPSGLGVREASMYGLLLAVTSEGPALGAALMNRLTITVVELALFGVGVVSWRFTRR